MEKALRRLKKKLDREGIIRDVRANRYFEKPSEVKRRKNKASAFSNMLRQRYENQ
nr:30S ribosomal protein S21 [Ruficoccus sp. ZRK36]